MLRNIVYKEGKTWNQYVTLRQILAWFDICVERLLTNTIRHVVIFKRNGMTDITHWGVAAMMHKCSTEWHAIQGPMFNTSD